MKIIKLDDRLYESLIDMIGKDFMAEYEANKESKDPDVSYMKDDYEILEACFKCNPTDVDNLDFNRQVLLSRWKDMIQEIENGL